jgi:hypothetical protein
MHTRQISILVFLAAAAMVIGGCPAEKTVNYYYGTGGIANFPGTPVSSHNIAKDGQAFSEGGASFNGTMRYFPNRSDGTGILLFQCSWGAVHCYAAYFDGTRFWPSVEILGWMADLNDFMGVDVTRAFVLWLNTANNTVAQGLNRHGDAIIVFQRREVDTTGTPNSRLYSSYFDRTHAATPQLATDEFVCYGFDTAADLVDTDDDYEIAAFGGLSDSWYSEFYGPVFQAGPIAIAPYSGEETTFAAAFWLKPNAGGGTTLFTAAFDLSDANTANDFGSQQTFTPATTFDTDDAIAPFFWVHNGSILYLVALANEAPSPDHILLEWARWNTASNTLGSATVLSRVDPNNAVSAGFPVGVFGDDHGLGHLYVVGNEAGFQDTGVGPSVNPDTDAMLYIVDLAAATAEQDEIDNETGTPASVAMDISDLKAAIVRDGSWIAVGWKQDYSTTNSNDCLFMEGVQTVLAGGTARSLANSVLGTPVRMNSDYTTTTNAPVVNEWEFQDLFFRYGHQSDVLRVNVLFTQDPDAADTDNLQLRTAWMGPVLDPTGSAPPALASGAGSGSDNLVWENDVDHVFWNGNPLDWAEAVDAGSGGAAHVYFIGDGDGAPLIEGIGDDPESRLFHWDGTTTTEIGGDCPGTGAATLGFSNARQVQSYRVIQGPVAADPGNHPASYHHVLIVEERSAPGTAAALRFRRTDTSASATGAGYWPPLSEQPRTIDTGLAEAVSLGSTTNAPPLVSGDTLGVFFMQANHLYYNEYSVGGEWYQESGQTRPELVDDVLATNLNGFQWEGTFRVVESGTPDLLSGTLIFFWKMLPGSWQNRIFVRVKN